MKSYDEWRETIIATLDKIGLLDGRSELLSEQLASSLHMRDLLQAEMDKPDFSVELTELSREGNPRVKVNDLVGAWVRCHTEVRKDLEALLLTLPMKGKFEKSSGGGGDELTKLLNEFSDGDK